MVSPVLSRGPEMSLAGPMRLQRPRWDKGTGQLVSGRSQSQQKTTRTPEVSVNFRGANP